MTSDIDKGFFVGLPKKALFGYPLGLIVSSALLVLSATSFGADYLNSITSIHNTTGQWFQRSGSIVTSICAVIEALILVRIHRQMRGEPTLETERGFLSITEARYLELLQFIGLLLVIFGTLVWGYGDVLHELIFGI